MQTLDPKSFLLTIHPFDQLPAYELDKVIGAIDVHYYKPNEIIQKQGEPADHYFIIAKGVVEESDGEEKTLYATKDTFDAVSIMNPPSKTEFKALEESILFAIPSKLFLKLIKEQNAFESYYLEDISKKVEALLNKESSKEMSGFMLTHIKDSYYRPVAVVKPDCTIYQAVTKMGESNATAVLVDFGDEFGIVSDSDLRKKVILKRKSVEDPIKDIVTKPICTIDLNGFLWDALLTMTERNIKRVVVTEQGKPIGMIEQMDLISAMSNKSHLMQIQIQKASTLEEVQSAAQMIEHLIRTLKSQGVKVHNITALTSRLNTQIYRKLWELIVPKEIIENSCLFVMGSEGREEQTLRTDQDNALILREGFTHPDLEVCAIRLNDALVSCGFPLCEGGVMAKNAFWRKDKSGYQQMINSVIDTPNMEGLMNLAILYDAKAVAGDVKLLDGLKNMLITQMRSNASLLASFAKSTLAFETPLGLFANFITAKEGEIDIKKGGIFAIVQGIRSLSIAEGLLESSTVSRINALSKIGVISEEMRTELVEAFDYLLSLRLSYQLDAIAKDQKPNNMVSPAKLSKIERDILRDSFKIVDRFKKVVAYRFKLGLVS